jgi:hypothetical protein
MLMADEMNPRILGEWLARMSLPERARTLNRIAYDLTICAREFEAATQPIKDPATVITMLIGLSELQHQLSQQIGHYMDGEEIKVYPIDVFAQILFEKATHYQILPLFEGSNASDEDEDVRMSLAKNTTLLKTPVSLSVCPDSRGTMQDSILHAFSS